MKLTRAQEIAILFTSTLASTQGKRVSLSSVAGQHAISTVFLKKIVRMLHLSGLVVSKEGADGGYILARPANEISVLDILSATGGKIEDVKKETGKGVCPLLPDCLPQKIRRIVSTTFLTYCSNITLDQFIRKGSL